MKAWKTKLDGFLNGEYKLFEEDYKITYPCIIKRGRRRIKAKIDIENGIVYGVGGQVITKCKGVYRG